MSASSKGHHRILTSISHQPSSSTTSSSIFIMQLSAIVLTLMASSASARLFTLFDNVNYNGPANTENRPDDNACWNLNGKGDKASSVSGSGCTWFYRDRDCNGESWYNKGSASTVPGFLNDHIYSFRNVRC